MDGLYIVTMTCVHVDHVHVDHVDHVHVDHVDHVDYVDVR